MGKKYIFTLFFEMGIIRQAKRVNGKNQPVNKLMRLKKNVQKIISQL